MEFNVEKFMNDYQAKLAEKDSIIARKEAFENAKRAEIEQVCGSHFSNEIKAKILEESLAEKAEQFNIDGINAEISFFEQYLIQDEVEESALPVEENTEFPAQA